MEIIISDIINDSIVDGPGIRLTIFTQGCRHNCPNCHNPQTHSFEGGKKTDTDNIVRIMKENPLLDGITLSGGDPFEQAASCSELAIQAHKLGLNVWTYTGYTFEEIVKANNPDWNELLKNTDVLIDGPFLIEKRSLELRFKGSRNQRLIDVNKTIQTGIVAEIV